MSEPKPGARIRVGWLLYVVVTSATALFVMEGWILAVLAASDPLSVVMGDWIQFHRVGERLAAADWSRLYPDSFPPGHHPDFPDGLYFLYPPFALPGTLAFAGMTLLQAYVACVAIVAASAAAMVTLLTKALRGTGGQGALLGLGVSGSAFFLGGLLLGHLSMLLGLVAAGGFLLHRSGRPAAAGMVWALLLAKPNWGIPLLMLCIAGRDWRLVRGFAAGAVLCVLLGAALGHGLWADWIYMVSQYNEAVTTFTPPQRQITAFASLQSVLGLAGTSPTLRLLWLSLTAALALPTAVVWWKGEHAGLPFERQFGTAILVILAVNPYAYFYDGVLLATPAAVWWMRRDLYGRKSWSAIGGLLAFMMLWEHLMVWPDWASGRISLVGLAVTAWAVIELVDLGARAQASQAPSPSLSRPESG